jgi:heme-degrading monooxygenase HmoA
MSVIVMLQLEADPAKMEEYAAANKDKMAGIVDRAKSAGLIAHRFFGDDAGHVVVLDEWPDAESFQGFFSGAESEIGPMMQEVGVTSPPQPQFLRVLETHDKYGWES